MNNAFDHAELCNLHFGSEPPYDAEIHYNIGVKFAYQKLRGGCRGDLACAGIHNDKPAVGFVYRVNIKGSMGYFYEFFSVFADDGIKLYGNYHADGGFC